MKLYLETSVPSMLFASDAPDLRRMTESFFKWARRCSDEFFTSTVVEDEVRRATPPIRAKLLRALASVSHKTLAVTSEARGLAALYVRDGIVPARYVNDALHVAIAVCERLDVVVSWNMEHLVNVRAIERINRINLAYSLPPIRIHTPVEVMET